MNNGCMRYSGIVWQVVLYFALRPGDRLTTRQIAERWHRDAGSIPKALRSAIEEGYLANYVSNPCKGRTALYGPGERLLAQVGKVMQQ